MALQKEGVVLAAEGANKFIADMSKAGITWDATVKRFRSGTGKFISTNTALAAFQANTQKATADMGPLTAAIEELTIAVKKLGKAEKKTGEETDSVGKKTKDTTSSFSKFFGGFRSGASSAAGLKNALASLTGSMGALGTGAVVAGVVAGAAVAGVAVGVGILAKKLADLAKQTAPLEGLQAQFANLTATIEGGTSGMLAALRAGSSGMIANRDLMQQFNNAASLVNVQFAERLPEALNLLGKVSAATGTDMAYLMDSLVNGVGKVSNVILDNLKIQVSSAEATAKAEEMFNKEADSLTKLEQQTAMADIALTKLEEKYGALPDVSQTASAQAAILNASFQNISDTLGQFVLPAWTSFLQGVNAIVGAFSSAISEGGAFYPILVNLGAALSIAADGFKALAERGAEWINNLSIDWTQDMGGIAESAIQWGADIVTNFAVGILDAANTVLTWAMEQIGNILLFWMGPGSPPRMAPNLDKWGMAAFESYLHGMTEADFGILESVQGPLKKVLEGPQFANVSKALAGALEGGDRAGALDILAKSSAQFGNDIAELARREFALADATQAVTDAENALLAAQNRAAAANKKVATSTREYNRLLREGASQDILDAQLARINASEKEAVAARKAITTSETGLEDAKSRVDVLKEQVDWQKRFIQQLFGINEALTEEEKREKAAEKATKGKGTPLPEAVAPTGPAGGIGGAIAGAIEAAKGRIKESLSGIWDTIKTEFSEKWDSAIEELGKTWEEFKDTVGESWDKLKEKYTFLQDIEDWVVDLPEKIRTMISDGWDKFSETISNVWDFVETYLLPILNDLQELGILALQAAVLLAKDAFFDFLDQVRSVWTWMKNTFLPFMEEKVGPAFTWFMDEVIAPLTEGVRKLVEDGLMWVHEWLQKLIDKLREWIGVKKGSGLAVESPESPLSKGTRLAAEQIERLATVSVPKLNRAMAYQPAGVGMYRQPAGNTYNSQANSFNFNTSVNNGMDQAGFEAAVLRAVRRGLAQGAV